MTLLTVVQGASVRLGLPRPTAAVGTTDNRILQLIDLANEAGRDLVDRYPWQKITKEKTFTTIAAETQTGAVPTDLSRIINETVFNRTETERVFGPLSAEEWQVQKARNVTAVENQFRIRGDAWLMYPAPSAGQTIAYEYVSTYWVDTNSDGTGDAAAYSADAHVSVLPEELVTLSVVWRFQQATGLDYSETFRKFEVAVSNAAARDGGKRRFSFGGSSITDDVPRPYVPDGNWSLT